MTLSLGVFLIGAAIVLIVAIYVVEPFVKPHPQRARSASQRETLVAQKEALLQEIHHLDFDLQTGVLSQTDYEQQRRQMLLQAARVAEQLDKLPSTAADSLEDRIENAVARQRGKKAARTPARSAAPAGKGRPVAVAPGGGAGVVNEGVATADSQFCPQCGRSIGADDRFCRSCGHQLDA